MPTLELVRKPKVKTAFEAITVLETIFKEDARWKKHGWGDFFNSDEDEYSFSNETTANAAPYARTMCLAGGIYFVDGPKEADVRNAVALAILALFPARLHLSAAGRKLQVDKIARAWARDDETDDAQCAIVTFNDHDKTIREDVLRVIEYARTVLMGMEAYRHALAEADNILASFVQPSKKANAKRKAPTTAAKKKGK
jgi:hypothetical protein